jgi:hypothetical protein
MSFRDDRDALRAQLDAVRRELEESREQVAVLEHEIDHRDALLAEAHKKKRIVVRSGFSVVAPVMLLLISFAGLVAHFAVQSERVATAPAVMYMPAPERWTGAVRDTWNHAPVDVGDRCELWVEPVGEQCRFHVDCAGRELFAVDGRHGYSECGALRSPYTRAEVDQSTSDGDPRLNIDRIGHQVALTGADGWIVRIAID